jgi:hypothetical protein
MSRGLKIRVSVVRCWVANAAPRELCPKVRHNLLSSDNNNKRKPPVADNHKKWRRIGEKNNAVVFCNCGLPVHVGSFRH